MYSKTFKLLNGVSVGDVRDGPRLEVRVIAGREELFIVESEHSISYDDFESFPSLLRLI